MRRIHVLILPLLALLVLVASGCGSTSGIAASSATGGASVAPGSAAVFVSVDTDSGSAAWKQADDLLNAFPARDKLLSLLRQVIAKQGVDYEQDVKPALGNEVDIVVLDGSGSGSAVVGLVQPKSKQKLDDLVAKLDAQSTSGKAVTGEYKGWTLISDHQASIDRFTSEADQGSLADDSRFTDAMARESDTALVKAYVNGASVQSLVGQLSSQIGGGSCGQSTAGVKVRAVSAALSAEQNGLKLHAAIGIDNAPKGGAAYSSQLLGEIPSGALVVASFKGSPQALAGLQTLQTCQNGKVQQGFQQLEQLLGIKLGELGSLFKQEVALYVRAGSPLPEVTIVAQEDDPQAALATLDKLAGRLAGPAGAAPKATTVDGVPAKEFVVGGRVSIFYAALDGKIVVTDSEAGIRDLRGSGPKLKDDAVFKEAQKASGMPDQTTGFVYVDLKDSIPLIESLVRLAGIQVPADVDANLRPLQTLMLYGSGAGDPIEVTMFLEIK